MVDLRPEITDETSRQPSLRARLPHPMLQAVDLAARRAGMSRSAVVRELLSLGLAQRGLWPPPSSGPARNP